MNRKNLKRICIFLILNIFLIVPVYAAGWEEEDGNWVYYQEDGTLARNIFMERGAVMYYLGSDGMIVCDQLIEIEEQGSKKLYYMDSNGCMVRNTWIRVVGPGGTYEYVMCYGTDDGTLYMDTLAEIDGEQYYFNQSGFLVIDTHFEYEGNEYVADEGGGITLIGSSKQPKEKYGQEELKVKVEEKQNISEEPIKKKISLWQRFLKLLGMEKY